MKVMESFRGAERSPGRGKREASQRSKVPGPLSPWMQAWEHVDILCPPLRKIKANVGQNALLSSFRFTVGGANPTTSLKRRPHQGVQVFGLLASTRMLPGDDQHYCMPLPPQKEPIAALMQRQNTVEVKTLASAVPRCPPLCGLWQEGGSFLCTCVLYCKNLPHRTAERTK